MHNIIPDNFFDVLMADFPSLQTAISDKKLRGEVPEWPLTTDEASTRGSYKLLHKELIEPNYELIRQQIRDQYGSSPNVMNRMFSQYQASSTHAQLLYSAYIYNCVALNHDLFGRHTYHIPDKLAAALAKDESDEPNDRLRLKSPSSLFTFTSPQMIVYLESISGGTRLNRSTPISVFIFDRPYRKGGRHYVILAFHGNRGHHYSAMIKREVWAKESETLTNTLQTNWDGADVLSTVPSDIRFYRGPARSFFWTILKAIAHLNSPQAIIEKTSTSTNSYLVATPAITTSLPSTSHVSKSSSSTAIPTATPNPNSALQVMLDANLRKHTDSIGYQTSTQFISRLESSKFLDRFRETMYEFTLAQQTTTSEIDLAEMLDAYIEDGMIKGTPPLTNESAIALQKGLAATVWRAIFSHDARNDYDALFNHAYLMLVIRIEGAERTRRLFTHEKKMHVALTQLPISTPSEGTRLVAELEKHPLGQPYAIEGSNLFNKICAELTHEMLGLLLKLPHLETLRGAGNANPEQN
jgi:hypothetical protein